MNMNLGLQIILHMGHGSSYQSTHAALDSFHVQLEIATHIDSHIGSMHLPNTPFDLSNGTTLNSTQKFILATLIASILSMQLSLLLGGIIEKLKLKNKKTTYILPIISFDNLVDELTLRNHSNHKPMSSHIYWCGFGICQALFFASQ
jgi:hypothetical protein